MKKIWIILIIGIILRLFLALSTFHPDIQAFNLAGKIISEGNILNVYDYLPNLEKDNPLKNLAIFNYPPPIYWFEGFFNFIFSMIFGKNIINGFLVGSLQYGNILFNLNLLLIKLPYLIFDLATAFVLLKIFENKREKQLALILWMFNPINLFATYMMGQFDIIPTFFMALSLFLFIKKKLSLAALALGFGISFKIFPIFFVIPLIIYGKNNLDRIKLIGLSMLPYIMSVLPYITSHNFRSNALFASQSSKSLYANLPVSGGETILIFPMLLLFFYFIFWNKKETIWKSYFIILLLFFSLTHFHPQWLLWLTPFLILDLVKENFKNWVPSTLILLSWIASLFLFDPFLNIKIFAPLIPALGNLSDIWTILGLKIDFNMMRSILQTILVASSFYFIYLYFPKKDNA